MQNIDPSIEVRPGVMIRLIRGLYTSLALHTNTLDRDRGDSKKIPGLIAISVKQPNLSGNVLLSVLVLRPWCCFVKMRKYKHLIDTLTWSVSIWRSPHCSRLIIVLSFSLLSVLPVPVIVYLRREPDLSSPSVRDTEQWQLYKLQYMNSLQPTGGVFEINIPWSVLQTWPDSPACLCFVWCLVWWRNIVMRGN